jgi:membrane protease YdiL (CAAX protease family)
MSKRFRLYQHPWLGMFAVMLTWVVSLFIFIIIATQPFKQTPGSQTTVFTTNLLAHITLLFVLVPFVLRLPAGKQSYQTYLDSIRLSRVRPFFQLLLLALSCYLIQALCQVGSVLIYRASQGLPITWISMRITFDLANLVPSDTWSWLNPLPSIFEEVTFRGVVLSLFLTRYSKPQAVLFSALGFGAMHLLNLTSGQETVWVMGQFVWSTIFGLFYGVLVLKANSLWPAMLIHYLGNLFIWPLTGYVQHSASVETQAIYGILFFFGVVPTVLMILWTFLFTKIWPISMDKIENIEGA